MAEGTSERNGPISNIMSSFWSNGSNNDDAFFDSLKLVSYQSCACALVLVPFKTDKKAEDNRIFHFLSAWCILFRTGKEYTTCKGSVPLLVMCNRRCCCCHSSFWKSENLSSFLLLGVFLVLEGILLLVHYYWILECIVELHGQYLYSLIL